MKTKKTKSPLNCTVRFSNIAIRTAPHRTAEFCKLKNRTAIRCYTVKKKMEKAYPQALFIDHCSLG